MFSSLYRWHPGSLAYSGHSAGSVTQMNQEDTEKQLYFVSLTGLFARSRSIAMGSEGPHEVEQMGVGALGLWIQALLPG